MRRTLKNSPITVNINVIMLTFSLEIFLSKNWSEKLFPEKLKLNSQTQLSLFSKKLLKLGLLDFLKMQTFVPSMLPESLSCPEISTLPEELEVLINLSKEAKK